MEEPSGTPPDPGESKEALTELVDATVQFTHQLMKKGVSQATLQVAVRCRPLNDFEKSRGYVSITRLVDDKVVIVLDPEHLKEQRETNLDVLKRSKEKQYVFDRALGENATNAMLYNVTVAPLVHGVLRGLNATVFAYGATGSGKTHTMVGDDQDPGLMVLSLRDIFEHISREQEKQFIVECSYMEVYNELLYDLLENSEKPLELREDPKQGAVVVGLKRILVPSADHIFALLREGNKRRKTESTDANATSSRSHAVLEILCTRSDKNCYAKQVYQGKLALVDLAGAERAHETNNAGRQLRDGANINKSLLALANCINALGKRKKKEFVFVPFRNSKLTRLLKDGLCGNSRTIMVATVSACNQQYHHTVNTLKYANRAKEIKTHVRRNQGTVDTHIKEYQKMIDNLQQEVRTLRGELTLARTGRFSAESLQGLEREPSDAAALLARSPSIASVSPEESDGAGARIDTEIARLAREREGVSEALYRMDEEIVGCNSEIQQWQNKELLGISLLGRNRLGETTGVRGESEVEQAEKKCDGDESAGGRSPRQGKGLGEGLERTATTASDVNASLDASWLGASGEHAQMFSEAISDLRECERAENRSDDGAEAPGTSSEPKNENDKTTRNDNPSGSNEIEEKLKVIENERGRLREDLSAVDDALRALDIRIDREVLEATRRRALHLEIELVSARGGRKEAARAIESRNEIIDEQAEVISALWQVLECAGIDKPRALAIAKEGGLLKGSLSRAASVSDAAASPELAAGKAVRRRQRSLGGTRASRRFAFWQERLKDLPLIRTPSAPPTIRNVAVESPPPLPSVGIIDDKHELLPPTGWDSARSSEPVLMSHQSTPGRLSKPSRSYNAYVSQQRLPGHGPTPASPGRSLPVANLRTSIPRSVTPAETVRLPGGTTRSIQEQAPASASRRKRGGF
ncbi:Kinesin-like protein [Klebsormidium nitens]|uniref:Kinesin-like protein n=1 Tax=Klebsormidium nitens TaxID=105231 RepID=A0A1Y1HL31_KLENI|nr:Kinesin-like protein [Klebsormidium nitens]|eukprot:GAQ77849.1 Kinesin-like protein [Klebsormidium nitens]